MIQKWSAALPVSENLVCCYNGKFYEYSDGIAFFYKELSVGLIAVRISRDGQSVQTIEYPSVKTTIPAWWMISPADPAVLVCSDGQAFRMDSLTPMDDPPEELLRLYQEKRQHHHYEDDPFDFDHYRIEHTTSFGYRCRDLRDGKVLWKRSLNGYLYHDMIRVPGTDLILICTAEHGGSVYAVDLPTGEIRYEVKTGGTRHIVLSETCFYCYRIGKTGELLKVDLQTGTILETAPLAFTDINCPLYRTSAGEIIAFSRIKVSKSEWQPILSCFTDDGEIRVCDECGSRFLASSSRMQSLCPECASVLYGYENCKHVFQNGRCTRCLWDGSRSDYIQSLITKMRSQMEKDI